MSLTVSLMLIAISLPMVASIVIAALPGSKPRNISDYFLHQEDLDSVGFMMSSVGYSLQAAAIYLFFFWTLYYGLWALFVPLSWCFGYFLLHQVCKKGLLDNFLRSENVRTIHGYVGELSGDTKLTRLLVLLISIATVIGVGGTMVAEADYVVQWLTSSVDIHDHFRQPVQQYGLYFVLSFALIYVLWGGYKAVINTDRIQVPIAYVAFAFFVLGSAALMVLKKSSFWGFVIILMQIAIFYGLYRNRKRVFSKVSSYNWTDAPEFWVIITTSAITFLFLITQVNLLALNFSNPIPKNSGASFFGFGFWGVVSLVLANMLWQLIDISSLQRLQSVRNSLLSETEENKQRVLASIKLSGVESAFLWIIIVLGAIPLSFLGLTEPVQLSEVLVITSTTVNLEQVIGIISIVLFLFALTTFALSTVDAFVSALSYVSYYDILKSNSEPNEMKKLSSAKLVTIVATFIVVLGFFILKSNVNEQNIGAIMYAIYAVQLSILPVVFHALFKSKVNTLAGVLSVIVGAFIAYYTATSAPLFGIDQNSWWVIPPLAVLVVSTSIYVLISFISEKRKRS